MTLDLFFAQSIRTTQALALVLSINHCFDQILFLDVSYVQRKIKGVNNRGESRVNKIITRVRDRLIIFIKRFIHRPTRFDVETESSTFQLRIERFSHEFP